MPKLKTDDRASGKAVEILAKQAIFLAQADADDDDHPLFSRSAAELVAAVGGDETDALRAAAEAMVQTWLDDEAPEWGVENWAGRANSYMEIRPAEPFPTRAEPDRRIVWMHYASGRGGRHGVAITGQGAAARYAMLDGRKRVKAVFDDPESAGRETADALEDHLERGNRGDTYHFKRSW